MSIDDYFVRRDFPDKVAGRGMPREKNLLRRKQLVGCFGASLAHCCAISHHELEGRCFVSLCAINSTVQGKNCAFSVVPIDFVSEKNLIKPKYFFSFVPKEVLVLFI